MEEKDTITLVVGGESYNIGSITKPYTADDLGNFLIETGVLIKMPVAVLDSMIEAQDA